VSSLGEAVLDLVGDATGLNKDIDRAKADIGAALQKVGSAMQSAGRTMTAGLTLPIVGAGFAALKAASDLEESMNAVNVIFGETAQVIHDYGVTSATSVGMSQAAFNQLSAEMGAMLSNVGIPLGEVADETINLAERAADMASIFNTDVSQAFNAIQSAIKGEFNPLETFGVKMNMAMIEAKALEMGLGDLEGEVSDQAKAQAALALIYEQTNQLAGDFAATSDGLANSTKILRAELENEAAALGQELIPLALEAVALLREWIAAYKELTPEQKQAILAVAGMVAVIGPLLMMLGTLVSAVGSVITVVSGAGPVITAFGTTLMAIGAPVLGLVGALVLLGVTIYALGPQAMETLRMLGFIFMYYLNQAAQAVRTFFTNLHNTWRANFEMLKTIVGSIDWPSVGRNIVQGIANGISAALGIIRDAARRAAQTALSAAKKLLGIDSPSKVFEMEVGWQMGAGVARGWENSIAALQGNMQANLGGMVPAMAGASPAAGGQASGGLVGGLTIKIDTMIGDAVWVDRLADKLMPVIEAENQRRSL
jgi:hypothetical protein